MKAPDAADVDEIASGVAVTATVTEVATSVELMLVVAAHLDFPTSDLLTSEAGTDGVGVSPVEVDIASVDVMVPAKSADEPVN